jgi:hypothetical protein
LHLLKLLEFEVPTAVALRNQSLFCRVYMGILKTSEGGEQMKIIREVRNVLDGKYTIRESDEERKHRTDARDGFLGGESRVVRKLLEAGLAIPQSSEAKSKKRG